MTPRPSSVPSGTPQPEDEVPEDVRAAIEAAEHAEAAYYSARSHLREVVDDHRRANGGIVWGAWGRVGERVWAMLGRG